MLLIYAIKQRCCPKHGANNKQFSQTFSLTIPRHCQVFQTTWPTYKQAKRQTDTATACSLHEQIEKVNQSINQSVDDSVQWLEDWNSFSTSLVNTPEQTWTSLQLFLHNTRSNSSTLRMMPLVNNNITDSQGWYAQQRRGLVRK